MGSDAAPEVVGATAHQIKVSLGNRGSGQETFTHNQAAIRIAGEKVRAKEAGWEEQLEMREVYYHSSKAGVSALWVSIWVAQGQRGRQNKIQEETPMNYLPDYVTRKYWWKSWISLMFSQPHLGNFFQYCLNSFMAKIFSCNHETMVSAPKRWVIKNRNLLNILRKISESLF